MATFLISTPGETGQLFPALGIAQGLLQRGHRVLVFAPPSTERMVRLSGAELLPHRFQDLFERMKHPPGPEARLPWWMPKLLELPPGIWRFGATLGPSVLAMVEELEPLILRERVDCVVGDALAFGTRYAAERTGRPFASIGANPAYALDTTHLQAIRAPEIPAWLPERFPGLVHAWIDKMVPLAPVRARLGLPPAPRSRSELYGMCVSDTLHLVTTHREFMPELSFKSGQEFVGPLSFDPPQEPYAGLAELPPDVVLVSTTTFAEDDGFLKTVVESLAPLGIPLLVTGAGARELSGNLGSHVRLETFVPHAQVLPRVRALVTHGGWGTMGRALRQGVPMLVIPLFGDQPMNALRAEQLGLIHHLPHEKATPTAIREGLKALLADTALHERLRAHSERLRALDSGRLAAEALERLVSSPPVQERRAAAST